jgi:hypothetical protein
MKERGILMSAPMVRATLREIDPKTQTRRVVKWRDLQAGLNLSFTGLEVHSYVPGLFTLEGRSRNSVESRSSPTRCPYGVPGDRLWVRETWAQNEDQLSETRMDASIRYRADGEQRALDNGGEKPWRPSIFMPRWASRITLEVTGVRIERLQAISEADAKAEGANPGKWPTMRQQPYQAGYSALWDSINGAGSWNANPWVWVVTFRRI